MTRVSPFVLLLLLACEDPLVVQCVDAEPCTTVGLSIYRCGPCREGVLDCSSETCVGEIVPVNETCNGVDDDCDCAVDEDLGEIQPHTPLNTCADDFCGACRDAPMACVNGVMTCVIQPTQEVCDGHDNDCDCDVDEIPVEFSYSGPLETVGVGACSPRVSVCLDGSIRVVDEVLPKPTDVCFNGVDDDCDGLTDEADNPTVERSVVLVVDLSASMEADLTAARDSVCLFATASAAPLHIAIVAIAASGVGFPYVTVVSGFQNPSDACDTLYYDMPYTGSASEFQTDGITMGSAGGLPWPTTDRAVVVLTDEAVQEAYVTLQDVQIICSAFSFKLYIATEPDLFGLWQPTIDVCGGGVASLSALTPALEDWFQPECL
jgi:Putative metal-binding motif